MKVTLIRIRDTVTLTLFLTAVLQEYVHAACQSTSLQAREENPLL